MKKKLLFYFSLLFFAANSLVAQDKTWVGGGTPGVWEDPSNWDPYGVPTDPADDILISGTYSVTISSNPLIESVFLDAGADLTIPENKTLTVSGNGGDGVNLTGAGTTLTVHGTLISSNHGSDGIDVNDGGEMTISATGTVTVSNVGGDGMELNDNLTNDGIITITNPGVHGIDAKGSQVRLLTNDGSITISGGVNSIDGSNFWIINNYGTVTFSNASVALIDDGTNFNNYGTFKGNGNVENGNGNDLLFKPGSTLAPGTSVGSLNFEEKLDLTNVTLDIEINGASNYDKVTVQAVQHTNGAIILTGSTLNLSGTYTPVAGDEFMILEKTTPGAITGNFVGLPEGTVFTYKGVNMMITYTGGDGNDMAMVFDSPLPVELIDFNARSIAKEVKLSWLTATETNNDYFTIERSRDGRSFYELGSIPGKGNSTVITEYAFIDKNPLQGLNYYRLKQTDFDGQFSYSDIKTVEFQDDNTVRIYPTLVNNTLYIETTAATNAETTVVVRDGTGRLLKTFAMQKNENKKAMPLTDLLPGNYFISFYNNENVITYQFVKM